MSEEYAKLVISVDSRQVKNADGDLKSLSGTASKTEKSTAGLGATLGRLAGPLATFLSARKVAQAAEEYTNLTNRLKLVTDSTEQLAYAQKSVFDIAQETRQPLDATAELYQRIAQNASRLGLTFSEVASVTETVNKAVTLSGVSAETAGAGLRQFGQALASGSLRGDELVSILENLPGLAKTIADGLGVTVGELRKMGAAGELTSDKLIAALEDQKKAVNEQAAALQVTGSQAISTFNNSLTNAIGKLNEATGASDTFANSVLSLAGALDGFSSGEFLDFFRDEKQTVAGYNNEMSVVLAQTRQYQTLRRRLMREDPDGTVFFKFEFLDKGELDAQLSDLDAQYARLKARRDQLEKAASGTGSETPKGDAPEEIDATNEKFEKLLANLTKQADLYGVVTEEAKVRYAIEKGELGDLTQLQQDQLIGIARQKDAKVEAASATKSYTGAIDEEARAQEQLLNAYSQAAASLERQISLYGNASDAASLRYDLEIGALRGLNTQQKQHLVSLQDELDARNSIKEVQGISLELLRATGQEQAARDLQFELEYAEKIAEYERQGNVEALARLQTLKQIRNINGRGAGLEGISDAPRVTGLDAAVGGATSELARLDDEAAELEKWREQELERQQAFLEAKAINEEDYNDRIIEINRRTMEGLATIETAKNTAILQSSGEFFGNMAALSQSGNKQLGAIGKAAAIAQATISGFTAIQNALAVPPYPVGVALAISAGVVTAANIASIAGVGFQQGGYTGNGGVSDVAGVVHGKEFVFDADATARIGVQSLEAMRRGQPAANASAMGSAGNTYNSYNMTSRPVFTPGMTDSEMRRSSSAAARSAANQLRAMQRYN